MRKKKKKKYMIKFTSEPLSFRLVSQNPKSGRGLHSAVLGYDPLELGDSYKHGNELSSSIHGGAF
jgi:hypothetical protein